MQTRVIINGARGKMGRITSDTLKKHPAFQVVGELGREDNLQQAILESQAQIVVELTQADCVYENSVTIIRNNAHPVIGATGLMPDQILSLKALAFEKKLGGIIVPNFSIAAVLMMQFAALAARLLPDVEIIEAHHPLKLDAPSGTAMKTAEMINEARGDKKNRPPIKEIIPHARGADYQDVLIHSLRLPGVLAQQSVIFGNTGETLTITHNSIDRSCFMPGLLLACQEVLQLDQLYYGLEKLLPQHTFDETQ